MPNNTFEDYKIAVKKKYKEEKEGRHSNYLSSPTRAKLRDLCWEVFEKQDSHRDDLTVFNSFFGFPFDLTLKNRFRKEIDKFRPIETFFKEATDPTNVDAVNLGAILLDFHPRPFSKFRTCDLGGVDKESDNSINLEYATSSADGILIFARNENARIVGRQSAFLDGIKGRFFETIVKKSKWEQIAVVLIFGLLFIVTYLAFFKKECMQWSNDHYEVVDCDLEVKDPGSYASIVPLDKRVMYLKKIRVCDTTTFFNKNEDPVIWYGKTGDSIEYFNQFAPHPLVAGRYLKPITVYMIREHINGKARK